MAWLLWICMTGKMFGKRKRSTVFEKHIDVFHKAIWSLESQIDLPWYCCVCVCAHVPSHVWLFAVPWTVAHQAPLSMEISQERILELVAISYPRGPSRPRAWTGISYSSCIGRRIIFYHITWEAPLSCINGLRLMHLELDNKTKKYKFIIKKYTGQFTFSSSLSKRFGSVLQENQRCAYF